MIQLNLKVCAIILIIVIILYSILISANMNVSGGGENHEIIKSFKVATEICQEITDLELPHDDDYQETLENKIPTYFADYENRDYFPEMVSYLKSNIKYRRRCISVMIKNGKITYIVPNPKSQIWGRDGVDGRVIEFVKMLEDLSFWCNKHNLPLPETRFIIYVADTYAWEETARDFPWMIMAKPINKPGILIPDNSFLVHSNSGSYKIPTKPMTWAWDKMIKRAKYLKPVKKENTMFFKGGNTGTYKFATRLQMSKYTWDIPIKIDISGSKQSLFEWNKYRILLNLPGNQPWSYRLKYLFLLKSPVVNVDVVLRYDTDLKNTDYNDRWIQFFDPMFVPGEDYLQVTQTYYDNTELKNYGKLKMQSYNQLYDDINNAYTLLNSDPEYSSGMADSAYEKISQLSSSRIMQYMYKTICSYANNFTVS